MVSIELAKISKDIDEGTSKFFIYTINNFQNLNISLRTPISPLPLPEDSSKSNVLVKMEGNTKTVNITFTVANSATDLVTGEAKDSAKTIKTVAEQVDFLLGSMQGTSLNDRYSLKIKYSDIGGTDLVFYGFINDITLSSTDGTPVTFACTIDFIEGSVITTLDGDVPSAPIGLTLVEPAPGGGAGRLTAGWTAPSYKGGSSVIDNYDLEFVSTTTSKVDYKKFGQSSSPFTTPTNSLTPSAKYSFRVRANSAEGEGRWSIWRNWNITELTPQGVASSAT